jgi:tetratricopeptide (TPR) repeat protein
MMAEQFPGRDTWYNYGSTLMRLGRCREGIPALQRALTFDSASANAYINIATCYKGLGENRLALDAYAAAERADSSALITNFINHEWGGVFVRLGRYAEAEAAFRRMLARPEPNDQARGHRSLAYLDMLQGRYHSAIEHLSAAAALSHGGDAGTSLLRNEVLLADAYRMRGATSLAGRELDVALKVARSQYVEPVFLAVLGRALVRANRLADAREVLGRLNAAVKPENPADRSASGMVTAELALARGENEAAAAAIKDDLDGRFSEWRTAMLGRILFGRGRLDSALAVTAQWARTEVFGQEDQSDWELAPLDVARIAESLGDSATARAALQTFLDRWKGGDQDLGLVRDAKLHLARLQREARR